MKRRLLTRLSYWDKSGQVLGDSRDSLGDCGEFVTVYNRRKIVIEKIIQFNSWRYFAELRHKRGEATFSEDSVESLCRGIKLRYGKKRKNGGG